MGGKFAVEDNREIPDTMEALWHYPGDTLVTYTQFNANGAGATARPCEIEFRGTKGTLYLQGRRLGSGAGEDHAERIPAAHPH